MRQAIQEIVTEIERVKRLGFHPEEVSRAKRSILAEFEESYIERSQQSSDSLAGEYVSLFLDESPAPGVVKKITNRSDRAAVNFVHRGLTRS
jgi:zinc protease